MNTVKLDLIEHQSNDQLLKGIPLYPALVQILIKNPSISWRTSHRAQQFPTQPSFQLARKLDVIYQMIFTRGWLKILF